MRSTGGPSAIFKAVPNFQDHHLIAVEAIADDMPAPTEGNEEFAILPTFQPRADTRIRQQTMGCLFQARGRTSGGFGIMGLDKVSQAFDIGKG
jgi:hypothetical protein